jgi:hypothetical protein
MHPGGLSNALNNLSNYLLTKIDAAQRLPAGEMPSQLFHVGRCWLEHVWLNVDASNALSQY